MTFIIGKVIQDIFGITLPPDLIRWVLVLLIFLIAGLIFLFGATINIISIAIEKSRNRQKIRDRESVIEGEEFIMKGKPYVGPYDKNEDLYMTRKGAKTFRSEGKDKLS